MLLSINSETGSNVTSGEMEESESKHNTLFSKQSGCCSSIGAGPDFGLLDIDLKLFELMEVSTVGMSFWLVIIALMMDPFIKPVVGVLEYRTYSLSKCFGEKAAFHLYSGFSFLYSVCTYISYHKCLQHQPRSDSLQNNEVLWVGYLFLLIGLTLKVISLVSYGWNNIIGNYYFQHSFCPESERKEEKEEANYDPYYHPNGSSSILALTGLSLIMAKESGLVACVFLALAYFCAYQLEQLLLCIPGLNTNFLHGIHKSKIGIGIAVIWDNICYNIIPSRNLSCDPKEKEEGMSE